MSEPTHEPLEQLQADHQALDRALARFIAAHPNERGVLKVPIERMLTWHAQQAKVGKYAEEAADDAADQPDV